MTDNSEQPAPEATSESEASPAGPKRNILAAIKKLQAAEKMLALAAAAVLTGWIVKGQWATLFKLSFFPTCAFLGALGVLVLILLDVFGVKILEPKLRTWVIILFAATPVFGFVVDVVINFWQGVILAGAIVMGFAGFKITNREQLIGK